MKKNRLLIILLLLGIPLALFHPVSDFGFLMYDDNIHVYENPDMAQYNTHSINSFFKFPFKQEGTIGTYYMPVTNILWCLIASRSKNQDSAERMNQYYKPALFHIVNLLFHILNIISVFYLLRIIISHEWAACAGALFFGLHPVQIESFAWISELKGLLSFFFSVNAITIILTFVKAQSRLESALQPGTYKRKKIVVMIFATMVFIFALLSKPNSAIVPILAYAVGYDLFGKEKKSMYVLLLGWILLSLPIVLVTKIQQPFNFIEDVLPLWQRPVIVLDAISFYIGKIVLPMSFCADYGRTPKIVIQNYSILSVAAIPILLCIIFYFFRHKLPCLGKSMIVFLIGIAPVSGIVSFLYQSISTVADRYLYFSMLGPSLCLAWFLAQKETKIRWVVYICVMIGLSFQSSKYLWHWQNNNTVFFQILRVNPESYLAYNNLGKVNFDEKKYGVAEKLYKQALVVKPRYYLACSNLGNLYCLKQEYDKAVHYYLMALPTYNVNAIHRNIAFSYLKIGKDRQALYHYRKIMNVDENSALIFNNMGILFARMNQADSAIAYYLKALKKNNRYWDCYYNLSIEYIKRKNYTEALHLLNTADSIKPLMEEVHLHRGYVFMQLNETENALRDLDAVLKINPQNQDAKKFRDEIHQNTNRPH